jgi:hypothetical protein
MITATAMRKRIRRINGRLDRVVGNISYEPSPDTDKQNLSSVEKEIPVTGILRRQIFKTKRIK